MSCSAMTLGRVDEDDGHLGLLERGLGAQRGVEVGAPGLVHAAPDAGGVDEAPGLATQLDHLVDRVAGGAGDVVDDDPLVADQLVEHRALADVGPAEQRDPARTATLGRRRPSRRTRAAPRAGRRGRHRSPGRAGPRPATAGRGPRFHSAAASASVRWSSTLLATSTTGLPERRSSLTTALVVVGGADGGVDDEEHDVGEVDRDLGLLGDPQVDARGVDLPAAGVDERELAAGPLGVVGDPVAGDARARPRRRPRDGR